MGLDYNEFFAGYIECALWAGTHNDEPLDDLGYTAGDLSEDALAELHRECLAFFDAAGELLAECGASQAGHDFLLTRNGHGCGFWDGDWPKNGGLLTALCEQHGTSELYIDDDGRVCV